jgi:hypothetical protein
LLYGIMKLQDKIQEDRVLRRRRGVVPSQAVESSTTEAAK